MDRFEQIEQQVEREMRWLRMPRWAAEAQILAEHADGVRHKLRTKEAILAFLVKHGIPHEVIDHEAERNARVDAEAHKRMKAAALNRRRQMARPLSRGALR
jgi:protoheme ferro-lyase